jgi:hypothetical protein
LSWNGGYNPTELRAVTREQVEQTLSQRQRDAYLQLPAFSPRIKALAEQVTQGKTNDYDRALAIAEHLRTAYDYTTDLPDPGAEPPIEAFLFTHKRGHCEYFASSMVILLRSIGVRARLANGFLGGQWNEFNNFLAVRNADAHSWVEVALGPYGWVTFDPTPSAADVSLQTRWYDSAFKLYDSLKFQWIKYVLEYNLETQVELLRKASSVFTGREDGFDKDEAQVSMMEMLKSSKLNWKVALLSLLLGWAGGAILIWRNPKPLDLRDGLIFVGTLGASFGLIQWGWRPDAGWIAASLSIFLPLHGLFVGLSFRRRAKRDRKANPQGVSRLYAQLRDLLAQAGLERAHADSPERLVARARAAGLPMTVQMEALVVRYVAVRFGGESLDRADLKAMEQDLREIRRALRARA